MHLLLHFTRVDDGEDPYAFRFGRQEYQLHGEGRSVATATLRWDDELLDDLEALRFPDDDPSAVQRVGNRLRRFLGKTGWSRQEAEIVAARAEGQPVFLTISSNAAELYALPWELLTIEATGQRLGELPGVLIRYAWPGTTSTPETCDGATEGGRILFVHSDAAGLVPHEEHRRAIQEACQRGHYERYFDPERDMLERVSLDALDARLEEAAAEGDPISVLHILCHGTVRGDEERQVYGLSFYDGQGREDFVSPDRLRALLGQDAARPLRLVVVAACDSGNQGALGNQVGGVSQAVHQAGVPAVIASRFPLSVRGSIRIVETLYDQLLVGLNSLEDAFLAARERCIEESSNLDWASMQIYARPEDGDDTRPVIFRPYRGLLAFHAEHTRFFYGREKERAEVLSDLAALAEAGEPRFLLVAGASGTGKSSVVLGGAVPDLVGRHQGAARSGESHQVRLQRTVSQLEFLHEQLREPFLLEGVELLRRGARNIGTDSEVWEHAIVRLGSEPMPAIEQALGQRLDPSARFLLVIDQFEELFTHTDKEEVRQTVSRKLWQLATDDTGVHVLITIRVDFLGECGNIVLDEKSGLRLDSVAYDEKHRVFVAKMSREALGQAIRRPATRVGLALQEGLAEQILDDVGNEPGALPLVQYTLDLLWQEREGRTLTLAAYDRLGTDGMSGVVGALRKKADEVIATLSDEERVQARRLLVRLVSLGNEEHGADTRRRAVLGEVRPSDEKRAAHFDAVLERMVGSRLLVRSEDSGRTTVEVAHEALIRQWPLLREWMAEDRAKLVELQELRRWTEEWRKHGTLLVEEKRLFYALQVQESYQDDLDPDAREMIARSVARRDAQVRRNRMVKYGAFVMAGLMTALFVVAILKYTEADEQRREADRQRVVADNQRQAAELKEKERQAAVEKAEREAKMASELGGVARAEAKLDEDPTASRDSLRVDSDLTSEVLPLWRQAAVETLQQPIATDIIHLPDDTAIIAATGDGSAVLARYQARARAVIVHLPSERRVELEGHARDIDWAVFSADGTRALTHDTGGRVLVWDTDAGGTPWEPIAPQASPETPAETPAATSEATSEDTPPIAYSAAALSPDGMLLATMRAQDPVLEIWTVGASDAPLALKTWHPMEEPTLAMAFGPGGRLVTGGRDTRVRIWDIKRGRQIMHLQGHGDEVTAVAFSPSGTYAVSGSRDQTARIWRIQPSYKRGARLEHRGQVVDVEFRDDERVLTVTGQAVREWDIEGQIEPQVYRGHDASLRSVHVSRDQDAAQMITLDSRGSARRWNLERTRSDFSLTLRGHEEDITGAAFLPDNTPITASRDGQACLWSSEECTRLNRADRSHLQALAVCPTGEWAATSAGRDVWIWPLTPTGRYQLLGAGDNGEGKHTRVITSLHFDPTCRLLLSAARDGVVRLWRIGQGSRARLEEVHVTAPNSPVLDAALSPDGAWAMALSKDGKVQLFEVGGREKHTIRHEEEAITAAAFSPSAQHLAVGTVGGAVLLYHLRESAWESETPELLGRHRAEVGDLAFDPQGSCLSSASDDQNARVWALDRSCAFQSGGESTFVELAAHKDAVTFVHFGPDRTRVYTASHDGAAIMWMLGQDGGRTAIKVSEGYAPITALALSQDGERLLVGREDGSVHSISTVIDEARLKERLMGERRQRAP